MKQAIRAPEQPLKIGLMGPLLPYRGGIAQYTTQLHQALRKRYGGDTISFSRQYPHWLYPGTSDRLDGAAELNEPGVNYNLDIYNPLSWRRAADQFADSGCQLVLLSWWTLIWQPGTAYMARRLRRKGVKVVYLCHNLFDHSSNGLVGLVTRALTPLSRYWLKQADAYLVQSTDKQDELRRIHPFSEILFRMHPIYDRFPKPSKHWPSRGRLDLLFFGFIRPYKGLDVLLEALELLSDNEVYLTIAGEAWGDTTELQHQLAAREAYTEAHLSYVSDEEAANYISRADALVVPYRSATGSGVVALAYNYGKPVIATSVGGLKDAVVPGQTGILVAPNNPQLLADAIAGANRETLATMRPAIERFCAENSWDKLVTALAELA